MTFDECKKRLDNMSDEEFDKLQKKLADCYQSVKDKDEILADAIELSSMAMGFYCRK